MSTDLAGCFQPAVDPQPVVQTQGVNEARSLSPAPSQTAPDAHETDIVTATELKDRVEQRAKPEAELELSPPGHDGLQALRQAENQNEQRIAHLRARLDAANDWFQVDHAKAQLTGQAKDSFERSR